MSAQSWFECIRCGRRYPIDRVVYRCASCNGLLDVEHDLDRLRARSAEEWKELFDTRSRTSPWPYRSGVWAKKEWVAPMIDEENIVSLGEGYSPLLLVHNLAGLESVWIK